MKTAKSIIFIALLSMTLCFLQEEIKKTRFYAELDLYTGLKAGICRCFSERVALYTSMGIALASPTQVSYNIFAGWSLLDPQRKFGLDLNAGLIHGVFDVMGPILFPDDPYYDHYFFANPGLALQGSYPIGKKLRLGLRLGAEIMIGYEEDAGAWAIHPELEPNAAITVRF